MIGVYRQCDNNTSRSCPTSVQIFSRGDFTSTLIGYWRARQGSNLQPTDFEVRCSIQLSYERHADEKADKQEVQEVQRGSLAISNGHTWVSGLAATNDANDLDPSR